MATRQISEVLHHLRRAGVLQEAAGLTDGQLLGDFVNRHDEAALAALVRRHGTMVWGVCRRVLPNYHDAEDAFQATFLVLVRKAASIAPREMVGNWLYGVAHQTALKARATAAKHRRRERQVTPMPEPAVPEQELWHDLQPLLDAELSRLPAKYRAVIILCDLEDKTRKEAARQLGVPEGTVASRLATARVMLARRLARHGLSVPGGALGILLSHQALACVPTAMLSSTIKTASLFAAGQGAATGTISLQVAALTRAVVNAMFLSKLKIPVGVLLVMTLLGMGAAAFTHSALAQNQGPAKVRAGQGTEGKAKSGDVQITITLENAFLQEVNADGRIITAVMGPEPFLAEIIGEFKEGQGLRTELLNPRGKTVSVIPA